MSNDAANRDTTTPARRRAQSRRASGRPRREARRAGSVRAVVGVLLLTFALMLASCGGADNPPGSAALVTAVPIQASTHVPVGSQIAYQQQPPTSGPHYPVTADNGIYTDVVPEAYWVHNLKHGAIVAFYRRPTGQE